MGPKHLDEMIASLTRYIEQGYTTFLSSHYAPETQDDARAKISYLKHMRTIVKTAKTADEFILQMKAAYPDFKDRYLPTTAKLFYGPYKQ